MRVLIAGAGIGGLTAALALARRGMEVVVHERASTLEEVGAGLQQSPNAMRVHEALGTAGAIREAAFAPEAATVRDGLSGAVLFASPLGAAAEARYGAPYLHVHRADLQRVLTGAARAAGVTFELGSAATGYELGGDGAALLTEGGSRDEGDAVIAADGVRSALRRQMTGEDAARFTGHVAWRATVEAGALPPGTVPPDATSWAGPGGHVVTYYVRGGALVNVVAIREEAAWTAESWSVPGDPDAMRAAFAGWDGRVGAVLGAVRECWLWGLFDRPPLRRWTDGRAALLGDAAHAMLPFLAQGAAMAVEDGWVLAEALASGPEPAAALRRYEARRRRRTAKVQALSRANARLFHLDAGPGGAIGRAKFAAARAAPFLAERRLRAVYGYDVTRGNGATPAR